MISKMSTLVPVASMAAQRMKRLVLLIEACWAMSQGWERGSRIAKVRMLELPQTIVKVLIAVHPDEGERRRKSSATASLLRLRVRM